MGVDGTKDYSPGKIELRRTAEVEHASFAFVKYGLGYRVPQKATARRIPPRRAFAAKRLELGLSVHRRNLRLHSSFYEKPRGEELAIF
jgi:hypothetical protein